MTPNLRKMRLKRHSRHWNFKYCYVILFSNDSDRGFNLPTPPYISIFIYDGSSKTSAIFIPAPAESVKHPSYKAALSVSIRRDFVFNRCLTTERFVSAFGKPLQSPRLSLKDAT